MPEFISILRWIRDIVYPQLLETNENVKIVADNMEEVKALNTSIEDGVLPFEKIATTTETIDSLLMLNASNGDIVIVKDLNRGGTFIYNDAQSAVTNGGTIFDGWVRQYSGALNVKWFGAKGDGVTDDTTAIKSAIDSDAGIIINFPAGTFLNNLDIDANGKRIIVEGEITGQGNIYGASWEKHSERALILGGNSVGTNFVKGLQLGGAKYNEGSNGTIWNTGGHSTWNDVKPSRNYSSLELALNPTMATIEGSVIAGGNTITRLQGSTIDTFWIGKKCYFGDSRYKVTDVTSTSITVSNLDDSPASFISSTTDVFKFCIVYGTGTCNTSGTRVIRVSGDPFVIYNAMPSFNFKIDGVSYSVSNMTEDTATITVPAGTQTNVPYEFWLDINDQFATFRLHSTSADAENLSLYSSYDGYWVESQYGSFGKHRKITLTTGETGGNKYQQVVAYPNGITTLGGPSGRHSLLIDATTINTVNAISISGSTAGLATSIAARGSDTNVSLNLDTKGNAGIRMTSNSFGVLAMEVFGYSGTTSYPEFATGNGQFFLSARSSESNADITLIPKGTGKVRFGTKISTGDVAINGYITIKDEAGNTVKLATIA